MFMMEREDILKVFLNCIPNKSIYLKGDQLDVEKHAIERQIIPFLRKMYDLFDEQLPKHWQNINQFFLVRKYSFFRDYPFFF